MEGNDPGRGKKIERLRECRRAWLFGEDIEEGVAIPSELALGVDIDQDDAMLKGCCKQVYYNVVLTRISVCAD